MGDGVYGREKHGDMEMDSRGGMEGGKKNQINGINSDTLGRF